MIQQENVLIQRKLTTDLIREYGRAVKREHNSKFNDTLLKTTLVEDNKISPDQKKIDNIHQQPFLKQTELK